MNVYLIKSICRDFGDEVSHKVAAHIAGVSPSVWSDYCSFDKPDTSIPMHRAGLIEEKTGRRLFSRAYAECSFEEDGASADPRLLGAHALEAIARAELLLAQTFADNALTEAEKRALLAQAQRLVERAHDFASCVAALPTNETPARGLRVAS